MREGGRGRGHGARARVSGFVAAVGSAPLAARSARAPAFAVARPHEVQSMSNEHSERYYQLVFIGLKDPAMFHRYCELSAPIVRPYGGALERMLAPTAIHADAVAKPDIVNVVYYDSRDAFRDLSRDPAFREVLPLRSASITMATVDGPSRRGAVVPGDPATRHYLVEVARYGARGARGYEEYEAEVEPVMARYGYHVERVLVPDDVSGFPFRPDVVKIAYFDTADGMDRLHRDPAHARIETELYPAAVQQSVWVVGGVHPSTA
jgi:uncharacterized protein (DUF1330 family)